MEILGMISTSVYTINLAQTIQSYGTINKLLDIPNRLVWHHKREK